MSEDGDYMDGYSDGFIDGRGTMTKPLRWRTGPVEPGDTKTDFLVEVIPGRFQVAEGQHCDPRIANGKAVCQRRIPLSEILDLIGGE